MAQRESNGSVIADGVVFRRPLLSDGKSVHELIQRSPPLDLNSSYCYFLLCSHYAQTCVVARHEGATIGFVSAYLLPEQPQTLFIWQMAVDQEWRGRGVAGRMLHELLARPACAAVNTLETTVSPSNHASRQVFARLASDHHVNWHEQPFLTHEQFEGESHEEEVLIRIGPLRSASFP